MNAAICCHEPFAGVQPASSTQRLWRTACLAFVTWLRTRQAARATWRELHLLDERSLTDLGVAPGSYWLLDRQHRFR